MQGPRKLLIFAHRPEAQCFFKYEYLKPVEGLTPELYQGETFFLLLCGEGPVNALCATSLALGQLPCISEVWNMGIAGGLDENLPLGSIHKIRTSYGQLGLQIQFKSVTTEFSTATTDCLTTSERVLTLKQKNELEHFAPLVDRECWGVAQACFTTKKQFYAVKLISDFPSSDSRREICSFVKEEAEKYSDQLYRWWKDQNHRKEDENINQTKDSPIIFFPELYFTITMERKLEQYFSLLAPRYSIDEIKKQTGYGSILDLPKTPKQKTLVFLDALRNLSSPELYHSDQKLELLARDLKRSGASLYFDPSYEEPAIDLRIKLKTEQEKDNFINSLKRFSFEQLAKIQQGKDLD